MESRCQSGGARKSLWKATAVLAMSAGLTGPSRVNLQCGPNPVRAGAFRRVPEIQGLYPKSKPPLLGVVLILEHLLDRLFL